MPGIIEIIPALFIQLLGVILRSVLRVTLSDPVLAEGKILVARDHHARVIGHYLY
jgi:hypothetical protein